MFFKSNWLIIICVVLIYKGNKINLSSIFDLFFHWYRMVPNLSKCCIFLLDRWMDKDSVTHTKNGMLFSHKNKRKTAICDNMDEAWGHYLKLKKSDRERRILYDLTYIPTLFQRLNDLKNVCMCIFLEIY